MVKQTLNMQSGNGSDGEHRAREADPSQPAQRETFYRWRDALAAGLSGANATSSIVLTVGIAEVAAGTISMGLAGYLVAKSEANHYAKKLKREQEEIITVPDTEAAEVAEILAEYGIEPHEYGPVVNALRKKPQAWLDFMMRFVFMTQNWMDAHFVRFLNEPGFIQSNKWKQIVGTPNMDGLVKKPDLLSFYIASKILVSVSTIQELLEIDGVSYRLRREIELLESFDLVRCKTCKIAMAKRSDMLVVSSEGFLGAYMNPHGCVHEILTLHKTLHNDPNTLSHLFDTDTITIIAIN